MARPVTVDWEAIKADYEVGSMTLDELASKHGVNKGNISRRAKQGGWNRGVMQPLLNQRIEAEQSIREVKQQLSNKPTVVQVAFEREIDNRLRIAGLITSGIEKSQKLANDLLDVAETLGTETEGGFKAALIATDNHSKVTQRNAAVIFGTVPESKGSDSNKRYCSIVDKLKAKHARG